MSRETAPMKGASPINSLAGGDSPKPSSANININKNNNVNKKSLRERVNFFERISKNKGSSTEDLVDQTDTTFFHKKSSSHASDSSFEESYERLIDEGELNGSKIVKYEKITLKKSIKEITSSKISKTPSDEIYIDQSHALHCSKSSSIGSFNKFSSDESMCKKDSMSNTSDDRGSTSSEWYNDYRNQNIQYVSPKKHDYFRSKSQYDAHIVEIKGT